MPNNLALRPSYWACVSGGKDSLYMLRLILEHPERYPLDGVVHYEMEADYPFINDVIDYMESECKRFGIQFFRIHSDHTWEEIYYSKYNEGTEREHIKGFPTARNRWCNSEYKGSAIANLKRFLRGRKEYLVSYIGYCVDETKRYEKRQEKGVKEIYPLVDFGIVEADIREWAKNQSIFNHFYEYHRRCGCMFCPMSTKLELAYVLKYYPAKYEYYMAKAKETEKILSDHYGRKVTIFSEKAKYDADYIDNIVRTKWLRKLEEMEANKQTDIFDFIES